MVNIADLGTSLLGEAKFSLERIQEFNPDTLVRRDELGKYAFDGAVTPAKRIINLYQNLPVSYLTYFPDQQLTNIRDTANSVYNSFESFANFDIESAEPTVSEAQETLVRSLQDSYQHNFNIISPLISYATSRAQDFSALERDARAAVQSAQDQAAGLVENLNTQKETIETILREARAAAAEQGVTKQAIHFKTEADNHESQSKAWLKRSLYTSIGLGIFAVASLFLHHIPGLNPTDPYRAVQIAVSKVLIFGVIAYMLLLCARNFMSHKHNEVVNRHRQNALATFTALVEATSDAASADIVLSHAASCIFSPQETGYAKQDGHTLESSPALQLIPRIQQVSGGGS